MNCPGCLAIDKPFWGDCDLKKCCEARGHDHCGQCAKIPCETLTEYSYDKEQGDNGKRIEVCRTWRDEEIANGNGFDVYKFILDVVKQNADALRAHFATDAVICWHDSNEQLTVEEYIRANCEYENGISEWDGNIQRVEKIDGGMVVVTKIFSGDEAHFATAFIKLAENKIIRLDEYYSECTDVPEWRKEMNIGRPIN